jgi:hypothetical protein
VRDIFALQIIFGGLRINEYNPDNLQIVDDRHGGKKVTFNTSHTQSFRTIHNPIFEYSQIILKRHKGKIPFSTDELNEYNDKLKQVATKAGLKRKVKGKKMINGRYVTGTYSISEIISSYWARKTFSEMLESCGLHRYQIKWFAGHTDKDILNHYAKSKFQDVVIKRKLLNEHNVKPEKVTKL